MLAASDRTTEHPATWLALSGAFAIATAASTSLPWFKSAESPDLNARSHWLSPRPGGSVHAVGMAFWGWLIFDAAFVVAVVAALALGCAALRATSRATRAISVTLAVASCIVTALVMLELRARPPYGDGPLMVAEWGAFLGATVAWLSTAAALRALSSLVRTGSP